MFPLCQLTIRPPRTAQLTVPIVHAEPFSAYRYQRLSLSLAWKRHVRTGFSADVGRRGLRAPGAKWAVFFFERGYFQIFLS